MSCMVNKYYYIQRRGVTTLKSNRSRSLKMGPIDRSYSRACVTMTSSGACFVSKQLASTSFRRQVLSKLLVQQWRGSSGNVRLSNLLISSCIFCHECHLYVVSQYLHRISVCVCVQASGAKINDECKTVFQDIKLGHKYRYALFGFETGNDSEIVVLKKAPPSICYCILSMF